MACSDSEDAKDLGRVHNFRRLEESSDMVTYSNDAVPHCLGIHGNDDPASWAFELGPSMEPQASSGIADQCLAAYNTLMIEGTIYKNGCSFLFKFRR